MSGCGCGGGGESSPLGVFSYSALQGLAQMEQTLLAAQPFQSQGAESPQSQEKVIWAAGNTFGLAVGVQGGREGCGMLPILGLPVKVCWKFDGDIIPPKIDVKVSLTFHVFDKEFYSTTVRIKCDSILQPSSCSIEQVGAPKAAALSWFQPRCNWGCLGRCAPECITCGTDYYCWALCAARCIWRCCSIF